MCGYCIEYSAITLEPDEGPALLPYLGTTIASIYRPNGPVAWNLTAHAFDLEQDADIREAIALILWLRDADKRLLERLNKPELKLLDTIRQPSSQAARKRCRLVSASWRGTT